MSKTASNTISTNASRAVEEIASVMQSTLYLSETWASVSEQTRQEIISTWTDKILRNPMNGLSELMGDVQERPDFKEAWDKLKKNEQFARQQIFSAILIKYGFQK